MEYTPYSRFRTILVSALVGAAIVFAAFFLFKSLRNAAAPTAAPREVAKRGALGTDEVSTIELFESAQASVVYITSLAVERDFISMNVFEIPQGAGSGLSAGPGARLRCPWRAARLRRPAFLPA